MVIMSTCVHPRFLVGIFLYNYTTMKSLYHINRIKRDRSFIIVLLFKKYIMEARMCWES